MELITIALDSSLSLVGKRQNVMEAARLVLLKKGETAKAAGDFLDETTVFALNEYMGRRELLSQSGPILQRGLLCGIGVGRFFTARIASGTIFIFLVLAMLFPSSIILRLSGGLLGGIYVSSFMALASSMLLTSLVFSALALAIATWLPNEKTALWFGFFLTVYMAVFCGAIISESALPKAAAVIGKWLPLRTTLRMLSSSLFNYSHKAFVMDALKGIGFAAFLLSLGFWGLKKRG